jgi:hypothetical protein
MSFLDIAAEQRFAQCHLWQEQMQAGSLAVLALDLPCVRID